MALENKYKITVNTKSRMFREVPEIIANDNVVFEIEVYEGATLFTLLPEYSYKFVSKKLKENSVIREAALVGGLVKVELGTSEMTVPGKVEGTLQIFDAEMNRISSAEFYYIVKRDPSMDGELPNDERNLIIANESLLIDAIDKAEQSMSRVDELITKAPQPSEVVDARGGETTLGNRLNNLSSSLAQIANKADVYPVDFQAVGDGLTNDTVALQNAFNYAIANKKAIILNGEYLVNSSISVTADYVKIIGNNSKIIRDYSSITSEGSILDIFGNYTEQVITANIVIGDVLINTNSTGIKVGDIIYIVTDEIYTQRGNTEMFYNKGFASRVVSIVSPTQIRIADRVPYSFDVTQNLRLRKTKSMVCDIENLTLEFTGAYASKTGTGLNLRHIANPNIKLKVLNASVSAITSIYSYNGEINMVDGVGGLTSVGLNYGIMANGAFGTQFKLHCTTARHPMSFTGIPSYNAVVKDSILTSIGTQDGVSFDAHCAGKVDIINSKLPQGAKVSAGEYRFHNCYIGSNGVSPQACIQRRDSTFFKSLTVENCELEFHGNGAYIYTIAPEDFLLDYGNFTFKNNTIRSKNSGTEYNLISASGVQVTPNSVGDFIIKDNEFLLPSNSTLHLLYVNDVSISLKATTQGNIIVDNNIFNGVFMINMGKSSDLNENTADTFFKNYVIRKNISYNEGIQFNNFLKASNVTVEDNKMDFSQISSCKTVLFQNNKISSSLGVGYLAGFANCETVFLKDNFLVEKSATTTSLFYVGGVINLYFGSIYDTKNLTNIFNGSATNMYYSEKIPHSTWSASHIIMGSYHLWVDSTGKLRIKNGAPINETDGAVVGTQA